MTTIAPCPFCGFNDVEIDEVVISEFAIDCPECRAIGPITGSVMEAINLWNVRAPERLRNIKAESRDFLSQALNEGDGVYRP